MAETTSLEQFRNSKREGVLFWLKFFQARAYFKAYLVFSLCVSRYERIECSSSGIKEGKRLPEGFLFRSTIKLRYGEIKKLFEHIRVLLFLLMNIKLNKYVIIKGRS